MERERSRSIKGHKILTNQAMYMCVWIIQPIMMQTSVVCFYFCKGHDGYLKSQQGTNAIDGVIQQA